MSLLHNLRYKTRLKFKGKIALKRKVMTLITTMLMECNNDTINRFAAHDGDGRCKLEIDLIDLVATHAKTHRVHPEKIKELALNTISTVENVCNIMQSTFNSAIYCDIDRSIFVSRILRKAEES